MYYKTIILGLVFLLFGQTNDDPKIKWQSSRKLVWQDFSGPINSRSQSVALTASGLTFGYSLSTENDRIVSYRAEVKCFFYPEKSWYRPERANAYILAHEQLHFDITELYARRFRKELSKLTVNQNIKSQLTKLHKEINEALRNLQNQYDDETNHSINVEAQKEWENLISKELKKLEQYQSR